MRLFKLACLAYKPTDVNYRGMIINRKTMISVRRGLIDKLTNILPTCDLFSGQIVFPKRYFDDLMLEESVKTHPPSAANSYGSPHGARSTSANNFSSLN